MGYKEFTVEEFVLDRYFRQWVLNPNSERNIFWQLWLQRNPEKREILQEARSIILKIPRINYGWNDELEDSLWQDIQQNTQKFNPDEEPTEKEYHTKVIPLHSAAVLGSSGGHQLRRQWDYQTIGRVAATVLLVMTIGIATYLGSNMEPVKEPPVVYHTKGAPLGTKLQFILTDGTKVILNAGGTARFPEFFADNERRIEVTGEAFFEVAKDSLRPFRVTTGMVVTEALGTAFNVRYEQKAVEIALVEGKVQVSMVNAGKSDERLILLPGEQAYLTEKKSLTKDIFSMEKVTGWKAGILLFDGAGEDEFIRRLERWYGVKISTKGKASKIWDFSGRFKDKSLEYVLKSASYTMDFNFTIKEKKVKIIYK